MNIFRCFRIIVWDPFKGLPGPLDAHTAYRVPRAREPNHAIHSRTRRPIRRFHRIVEYLVRKRNFIAYTLPASPTLANVDSNRTVPG